MGSFKKFTWDMGVIYGGMGIYWGITVLYPIYKSPHDPITVLAKWDL